MNPLNHFIKRDTHSRNLSCAKCRKLLDYCAANRDSSSRNRSIDDNHKATEGGTCKGCNKMNTTNQTEENRIGYEVAKDLKKWIANKVKIDFKEEKEKK